MFDPKATAADSVFNVSMLMLAICAAIFLVVGGLLTFTIVRFRRRRLDDSREPAHRCVTQYCPKTHALQGMLPSNTPNLVFAPSANRGSRKAFVLVMVSQFHSGIVM
jgi:hypothetical protein